MQDNYTNGYMMPNLVNKKLQKIAGNYKIPIHTRIINTAVKVIGIKIDNMNFNCD